MIITEIACRTMCLFACMLLVALNTQYVAATTASQEHSAYTATKAGGDFDLVKGPSGITVDSNDDIYIADEADNNIKKFTSNGELIAEFGSYCRLDNGEGCIDVDASGPLESGDLQFAGPSAIVTDGNDNIYVVDKDNKRIQKLSSNGTFITKFGIENPPGTQSFTPIDISLDSFQNVYVTDLGTNSILKFSENGTLIDQWPTSQNTFSYPIGLAVDSSDNILATVGDDYHVEVFSNNGTFLGGFGELGVCKDEFRTLQGIAVDSNDDIYVADWGANRVMKFSANGTFLSQLKPLGKTGIDFKPFDLTVNSTGVIFVTNRGPDPLLVFKPDDRAATADNSMVAFKAFLGINKYYSDVIIGRSVNVEVICGAVVSSQAIQIQLQNAAKEGGRLELDLPTRAVDGILGVRTEDGKELQFEAAPNNATETITITFDVPADAEMIEIMATHVVPEFGLPVILISVAVMALTITITRMLKAKKQML